MRIQIVSSLILLVALSCNGKNESKEVIWQIKTPIEVQYIYGINDTVKCWSVSKGYFDVGKDGIISNFNQFKKDDVRNYIGNIKPINGVGIFAYLYVNENEKWIVEIKKDYSYDRVLNLVREFLSASDFLISKDKKQYLVFSALMGLNSETGNVEELPHAWLDIKTNKVISSIEAIGGGSGSRFLFINNEYYRSRSFWIELFDINGNEIKDIDIQNIYKVVKDFSLWIEYGNREFNINKTMLNTMIYGDDGYLYIIPSNLENMKSWQYYIIKLDTDLNLIGKRLVRTRGKYESRCISSIYVDKEGYIYIASDKEMTITKFSPVEKGEDSFVDLGKVKLK